MALPIIGPPVLSGDVALDFLRKLEEDEKKPKIDFSKEAEWARKILENAGMI